MTITPPPSLVKPFLIRLKSQTPREKLPATQTTVQEGKESQTGSDVGTNVHFIGSFSQCTSWPPPPTHCGPSGTLINFDPPPIQQRSHLGFICINRKNNFNRTKTLRLQVQKKPRHCDIIYIQAITAPLCLRARAEGRRRQPSQRQIPVLKS